MEVSSRDGYNVELMFTSLIRNLRILRDEPATNSRTKPQILQWLFNVTHGLAPIGRIILSRSNGGGAVNSILATLGGGSFGRLVNNSSETHTSPLAAIDRNQKIYQVSKFVSYF
jgi:hypothetical protein